MTGTNCSIPSPSTRAVKSSSQKLETKLIARADRILVSR